MPIHDYACEKEGCDYEERDYYLPTVGSLPPICPRCVDSPTLVRLWTTNRMHRTFQAFEFELDGGKTVTIDSLHKLRKVEADSAAAYSRGEGRPFVFRHYSQDPTNRDRSVFHGMNPKQIDPRKAHSAAAAMEFGTLGESEKPTFHPATLRAMEEMRRGRKD